MMQNKNNSYQPLALISLITTDLAAITRGRGLPSNTLDSYLKRGCGWVPANSSLTPQDLIPDNNPWGSHGDLRLMPDLKSRVKVAHMPDATSPALEFIHCNLIETDGTPWRSCTRTLLANEIAYYKDKLNLNVYSAFEHEFNFKTLPQSHAIRSFSLQSQRIVGDFGNWVLDALMQAGADPEMFLPEYGKNQYEVTCKPTFGLASADRAINIREIVRDIARQMQLNVSFSPKTTPDSVSSGVHWHISLQDNDGHPVLYDEHCDNNLSQLGQHWAAGVLRYLPALCALTAPTPVSYLRLQPHHWSAAYACLGFRNREAALRICPVTTFAGSSPAKQYNLEFRPMDATANPYLAVAGILMAGRLGIEQQLPLTACLDVDPEQLTQAEREHLGIRRLPSSLREALDLFKSETELVSCFPQPLLDTYFGMKEYELELTADLDDEQLCQSYSEIY